MTSKYTIESINRITQAQKVRCLSLEYTNNRIPLEWECEFGHKWKANLHDLLRSKIYCPKCGRRAPYTIAELNDIVAERGGKCASESYENARTPLLWECKFEHRWEATVDNVVNRGSWCPVCKNLVKYTIQDMQLIAEEREGKCISEEYTNTHTPLLWECKFEHRWAMAPTEVISHKSWCPICAHRVKHTIEEMKEFAEKKGGKCLSDVYVNGDVKLLWQCAEGHRWMARPELVLRGRWCPFCAREKRNAAKRLSIDNVKHTIEKFGYQWISGQYKNNQSKLQLRCKGGHIWDVSFNNMRKRHCPQCSSNKAVRNRYRTK